MDYNNTMVAKAVNALVFIIWNRDMVISEETLFFIFYGNCRLSNYIWQIWIVYYINYKIIAFIKPMCNFQSKKTVDIFACFIWNVNCRRFLFTTLNIQMWLPCQFWLFVHNNERKFFTIIGNIDWHISTALEHLFCQTACQK